MADTDFKRWLYKGGKPNWLARILNRFWAIVHSTGIASNYLVTLEVTGRRTGRTISFPLVMVKRNDERYLVSMLGEGATWVKNIRASGGLAKLRHGRAENVRLTEIPSTERAPILKAYLAIAPGARPHVAVNKDAPMADFERVAAQYPVFRISRMN